MYMQYAPVNSSGGTIGNNLVEMGNETSSTLTYAAYITNSYSFNCYNNTFVVLGTNGANFACYATTPTSTPWNFKNNIYANLGNGSSTTGGAPSRASAGVNRRPMAGCTPRT